MKKLSCIVIALMALMLAQTQASIIYSNSFSGTSATLNGAAPDIRPGTETWTSSTTARPAGATVYPSGPCFTADGTFWGVGTGSLPQSAYLPVTLEAGKIYTLGMDLNLDYFNATAWFGMGIQTGTGVTGFATPVSRLLMRANGGAQALTAGGSNIDVDAGTYGTSGVMLHNIQIVLNTKNPTWTAEYKVDGSTIGTVQNLSSTPTTAYIALALSHNSVHGTMDNLSMTVIPEPATIGMLGLGALITLLIRHSSIVR